MKILSAMLLAASVLALSACVTETTGGFNSGSSPNEALENYIQLARGYLEEGDLAASRRHLNNAARIDSNNSDVYGIWGLIYSREGDLELADESFRRALRIDSGNSQVRNNYAAFLFANERFEEAYEQLSLVVEDTTYQARPQAFENMGLAALRLERIDDAEYAFNRALQLDSNRMRSALELTDIALRRGNPARAEMFYQRFLTTHEFFNIPHTARSLWIGIKLERAQGDESARMAYASTLEERFPDSPEYALYQRSLNDDE